MSSFNVRHFVRYSTRLNYCLTADFRKSSLHLGGQRCTLRLPSINKYNNYIYLYIGRRVQQAEFPLRPETNVQTLSWAYLPPVSLFITPSLRDTLNYKCVPGIMLFCCRPLPFSNRGYLGYTIFD